MPPPDQTTRVIRVTLRYGPRSAEILSAVSITAPVSQSDWRPQRDSAGAWIEVLDPAGKRVFAQPLPDPHVGQEVFTEGETLTRSRRGVRAAGGGAFAAVEVPWTGDGSKVVVHARKATAARRLRTAPAGSRVASAALEPEFLLFEGQKFPMHAYPRWGHDNPRALSLVFMSEGFRAEELGAYAAAVERTLDALQNTPPFHALTPALKAVRIDIPSKESGIGTKRRKTYFKGRFTVPRVIEVDQGIAARVLNDHVRTSARAMVVANTPEYGGSGGGAMVFSLEPHWSTEIAIHELGHAQFGLADEYSDAGQAATLQPVEPNVSKLGGRPGLKWLDKIAADQPLPTQRFGFPPPPDPKPLGSYEGAKYQKTGVWRPAFDCKMRTPGVAFCRICASVIHGLLAPRFPVGQPPPPAP